MPSASSASGRVISRIRSGSRDVVTTACRLPVCDGKAVRGFTHPGEAGSQHEVFITTDSRTAWHVMSAWSSRPDRGPSATGAPTADRLSGGRTRRSWSAHRCDVDDARFARGDPFRSCRYSSDVIATLPGSVVPAGKWISTVAKPVVSETGWLAIPISPDAGPRTASRASSSSTCWIRRRSRNRRRAPVGLVEWRHFAAISPDGVQVYDPAAG